MVNPTSRSVAPGSSTTYTVEVEFLGGFSSTETSFSLTGAPAGVTWSFTPNPLTHEGRTILEVRAASAATPGTYGLRVIAQANGLSRTRNITLVVSTAPDFGLVLSPSTQSAARGSTAAYDVTVSSQNGFSSSVTLDATGLPAGVTDIFVPNPVTPPATSQLLFQVGTSVPSGTYGFTVVGTSGTRTRSVNGTLIVQGAGNWTVSVIGSTGAGNNSVVVGPARNDGIDRVYVGTVTTGRVWEFSWDGSRWVSAQIGGTGEIHNLGMGPGRNDGKIRIYACSHDRLLELTYVGPGWSQVAVGTVHGDCTHAVVGNGRNDGRNRVYATRGNGVYEYEWTGSTWREVLVGTVTSGITHGLALGRGRNDTTNRLYIASTLTGTFEATYSGGWVMRSMGDTGDVRNVNLGPGRNDGVMRVYAATRDGYIREFNWTGSGWTSTHINQPVRVMVHAYVINGRNDGVMRVYGSAGDGGAYEYTFTGSGWAEQRLGGGSEYMYGFHYGRPRGTATRLYGSDFGADVYEYSWQ